MPTLMRSKSGAKTNQDRGSKLLTKVCRELFYAVSTSPDRKMPHGEVEKVVKSLKKDMLLQEPW